MNIKEINHWIDELLDKQAAQRISCTCLGDKLKGFYPSEFLAECAYVLVDDIPVPPITLPDLDISLFRNADGITYKNTYFIRREREVDTSLHFHELTHCVQWKQLGAESFIERYLSEILTVGYDKAPLEKMAYTAQAYFERGGQQVDMVSYVSKNI